MSDTIEDCLRMCRAAYPEYASIDPDTFSELMAELATLRANQLSPAIVAAVRAYQEAYLAHEKLLDAAMSSDSAEDVHGSAIIESENRYRLAMAQVRHYAEADAKERG